MAKKKKQRWLWVTPEGQAMYPYLATPDTKFGNDYRVDIVFTGENAKKVKEYIDSLKEGAKEILGPEEVEGKMYTVPYAEEEGGSVRLKTKQKAVIVKKTGETVELKVGTFDAKVQPIEPTEIKSGDLIKVEVVLVPYNVAGRWGLTARLKNVQLLSKNSDPSAYTKLSVEEQYVKEEDTQEDIFKELDDLEEDFKDDKIEF